MQNPREAPLEVLAQTPHLRLVRRGGWSFVQRRNVRGVVCVAAVTQDGRLVLVEQHRPPLNRLVIELPAGLAGDQPGREAESLEEAARRELFEETGYAAESLQRAAEGASSAGLCDELVVLYLARGVRLAGPGGGDGGETITVHTPRLDETPEWLARRRRETGAAVDWRVYAALWFLNQQDHSRGRGETSG